MFANTGIDSRPKDGIYGMLKCVLMHLLAI